MSEDNEKSLAHSSQNQFESNFRKNKRAYTNVARLAQKELIKNQIQEEQVEEEDPYENEQFLQSTFKDLGSKLYKSYLYLLLGDEASMKNQKYDLDKIMKSYLNNGIEYEQDYLDEKDFHMGDLVIEFPNPDYSKEFILTEKKKKQKKQDKLGDKPQEKSQDKDYDEKDTTNFDASSRVETEQDEKVENQQKKDQGSKIKRISLHQAQDDFKKAFSMVDASIRSDVSEGKIFQICFENAFKKLAQSPEGKPIIKQEDQDSHINESLFDEEDDENAQYRVSDKTSDTLTILRDLLFTNKQVTQKKLTKDLTKKANHLLNQRAMKKILDQNNEEQQEDSNSNLYDLSDIIQTDPKNDEEEDALNAVLKNNQFQQKIIKSQNIRKIFKGGKFLRLTEDKKAFERSENLTQDYLTLIRHTTWIRLIKYGFKLRHFLSQDAKSIFTVCYATDENLKITAEKEQITKELYLEFTDLLSLEPVDATLRPLRLNTRLRSFSSAQQNQDDDEDEEEINQNEKITGYLRYIRGDIQRLLQVIDYKKIARETNLSKLNLEILSEKAVEIKKDQNLTNAQWEIYLQYLKQLADKITELRVQYKFTKGDKRAQRICEIIEFQQFKHPLQQIIKKFLQKSENLKSENRTLNTEDSVIYLKTQNDEKDESILAKKSSSELTYIFRIIKEHLKDIKKDLEEVRDAKITKQKGQNKQDIQKEIIKQRQDDMKKLKKIYKKHRLLQNIMEIRSKRIRYLMLELINNPYLLDQKYEQLESEVKEHETKYSKLREIFSLKQDKLIHVKYIKQYQYQILAFKYREEFIKALDAANYPYPFHQNLKNLWDYMNMNPQETYVNYFRTPKNISFQKKVKLNQAWVKYEVTQNGKQSLFNNMERLKIVNLAIQKAVNLYYLQEKGYIKQSFFLNDIYDLEGKTYKYIFSGCPLNYKEVKKTEKLNKLRNFIINTGKNEQPNNQYSPQIDPLALIGGDSLNQSKEALMLPESEQNQVRNKEQTIDDYDYISQNQLAQKGNQSQQPKFMLETSQEDKIYVKKKIKNLIFEWSFKIKMPWYIPTQQIRDYYGEKVALYFSFLGFYTNSLLIIGIIGLIIFIIQQLFVFQNPANANYLNIAFGCLKIAWTSRTLYNWKRQEKLIASKYGQLQDKKGNDDERNVEDEERPGFDGIYMRSLITDNMNSIYYPEFKRLVKLSLTMLTCVLMLGLYFSFVAAIFIVPQLLEKFADKAPFLQNDVYKVIIPGFLNVILFLIFDGQVYGPFSKVLTDFENHKSFVDYERNYVAKKFIFSFISLSGPIFLIAFLGQLIQNAYTEEIFRCSFSNCYKHAQYHYATIFISLFSINLFDIIGPRIVSSYKQYIKKRNQNVLITQNNKDLKESNILNKDQLKSGVSKISGTNSNQNKSVIAADSSYQPDSFFYEEMDQNVEQIKFNDIINKIKISKLFNDNVYKGLTPDQQKIINSYLQKNRFHIINLYINQESDKEQYSESADIYGTVDEYLEICLQFSLLTMFGMIFPLSFWIAFIWNVIELQTDKAKLIKFTQRPIPLNEGSIGSWLNLMDLASYMSILTNSILITFLQGQINENNLIQIFLSLIVFNFLSKFTQSAILGDIPYRLSNLLKRQEYILRSTVEVFKKVATPDPDKNQNKEEDENQGKKHKKGVKKLHIENQQFDQLTEEEEQRMNRLRYFMNNKYEARPVFKIYKTICKPREQSQLHDSMNQSFEILSSDDENIIDKKKKNKDQISKQEQVVQIQPMLWLNYKWYCHQGVIQRPIMMKQQLAQQIQEYKNKFYEQTKAYLQIVKNVNIHKILLEKIEKYNRKVQVFNINAIWADQFRVVDNYKSTEQVLEILYRLRNAEQNQEKMEYDKIDVNINLITQRDIDKYFVPRGPRFQFSESFLKASIYHKLLNSMQTINMKKTILQKSPNEIFQSPYFEEKLHQERLVWEIIKQRFLIDIYMPQSLNQTPQLDTCIPSQLYPIIQNWKIQVNSQEQMLSFQIVKYDENFGVPLYLNEETELTMRTHSTELYNSGEPGFYIAKQNVCYIYPESMFNFTTRDQCYVIRQFNEKYICNLEDAVRMRRKDNKFKPYSQNELLGFLNQWLINLGGFQDQYQLYHSNITPQTLIQTASSNSEYKLINFQNLISGDIDIQLLRQITEEEMIFIAPELITTFFSSKEKQVTVNMYSADLYSLCMVLLYMATLGDSQTEFLKCKEAALKVAFPKQVTKQNGSMNSLASSMSDASQIMQTKKSESLSNSLTTNNFQTKEKKKNPLQSTSNLSLLMANRTDQKMKIDKEMEENTFDPNLSEGQNLIRILENYFNSQSSKVMREMYPILFQVIKQVVLQSDPELRPSREKLLNMIQLNQKQQFYENQQILRNCFQDLDSLSKSNIENEKKSRYQISNNLYQKVLLYNKISLFPQTINLLKNHHFNTEIHMNFEDIRRQIESQLQLIIAYIGTYELQAALGQLELCKESIDNILQGNQLFWQNSEMFKTKESPISGNINQRKNFYDPKIQQSERDIITRFQNYYFYLKAYAQFLIMDLRYIEPENVNDKRKERRERNEETEKAIPTLFKNCLQCLDNIIQTIVNENNDNREKNGEEEIILYIQTVILKIKLLIDSGLERQCQKQFNTIFNQITSIKSKLSKQEINKILIDQFYFEITILESEFYMQQSRYNDALNVLEEYKKNTTRYKRISQFKEEYLDNNVKILKDQMIFYSLYSDLCIVTENIDGYQEKYQLLKRNFFGMINNASYSFCFFYDILEQLFHLIELDSLKYDILYKLQKCLQFVYITKYAPEKQQGSISSFLEMKASEEKLFNPYFQFLIGKSFIGMDSPRDREAGYVFLYRAYKILNFTVRDSQKKAQIQERELLQNRGSLILQQNAEDDQGDIPDRQYSDFSKYINSLETDKTNEKQQKLKFVFIYNDQFTKIVEDIQMKMVEKSYFFQQRLIENILYCVDVDLDKDQIEIIEKLNYLYRMRPQRKISSMYFSTSNIEKKKKEIEEYRKTKKNTNKDVILENNESIRIEAAYIHQYTEFMRKAKLYLQFKKFDYALTQLKILNNLIQTYIKNYESSKKKYLSKQKKKQNIDDQNDQDKILDDLSVFAEKKQLTIKIIIDQISVLNMIALCYYGMHDIKQAKTNVMRVFKQENIDHLGPNFTIIRNIKGCTLFALDYRSLGIFQSSLMLIEIIDRVLQKVGHYPSVSKTKILQDLQILKNIVLFEAGQLELYYSFDEFREFIQKQNMPEDGNLEKGEQDDDQEVFIDEQKIKNRKSRPSLYRSNQFNLEEELNQETQNQYKMRGFYLHKQSQTLINLLNSQNIQQFKLQQYELTFFLSIVFLELGRYSKSLLAFKKVLQFDYNQFLINNDNISQMQFLYEKEEVRNIKISFTYAQILLCMHQYKQAQQELLKLKEYCETTLQTKKEQMQDTNIYYKQTYDSIEQIQTFIVSYLFLTSIKLGQENVQEKLNEVVNLNRKLTRHQKDTKDERTFLLLQISNCYYTTAIYHVSQMQHRQALETVRKALNIINKLMGVRKRKAKENDFKTRISVKTLVNIEEDDNDDDGDQSPQLKLKKNQPSTLLEIQHKVDPKQNIDILEQNLFENLILIDNFRCTLELSELELEQNLFSGVQLYELYYKTQDLISSIKIRKGEQSWFYFKILIIRVQILLKLLSNQGGNSVFGLIEYQKKIKTEKNQNFENQVYNIFGINTQGDNFSEADEKIILKQPKVQKLLKRFYSEKLDEEMEGYGIQGKIKVILAQFESELNAKDRNVSYDEVKRIIYDDLRVCEELLKKIYSSNVDINHSANEDFALLNMSYGEYLLQARDLLGSISRFRQSLKIFKQSNQSFIQNSVAVIYLKMAKMQDHIIALIHQNIELLLTLDISSVTQKIQGNLFEFAIKRMIMMDESVYKCFFEYSTNKIVIFLIDTLINIKQQFDKNDSNEEQKKLVYYQKSKQQLEMEQQVSKITNTSRDILEQIIHDKEQKKSISKQGNLVEDIYSKSLIEIIQSRRSVHGLNIKYMQKDSEIIFENKKIKYLRMALMVLKQLNCSHTDSFKEVEKEYMNALQSNFDYREEEYYLQYDKDQEINMQRKTYNKIFQLDQDDEESQEHGSNGHNQFSQNKSKQGNDDQSELSHNIYSVDFFSAVSSPQKIKK
ncbi:calcium-activated chloride channel protein (macronuclear) [Tetrahymena thermophila SB210]|uniref:Calcium-activated chloride channel protein n=1 Tax=Tetrahymena thermophila (strain SB210) TaxID=312017 RepID=I7LVR7_TETTS|nr:calcium-activated chloride channel protein [Tetrahymena thermophila SB210]EAR99585.2 calcium-activated chloride channel protein [Tetrahymena thermophila SB210]|eukprot:XP_001019830.2 calcium-activated chloride channel protein [Tetrahymena thermophila SB210]